ncbi:esterase/lipase [Cladophialophora psammophila CBS 110553]|uniref:Esterase/lipase n=1 Tax=Cladophialophora psammophila CBS 110553 TaxID=1182543 RepID=W9W4R3_9EURO|nr:esterase/lipase [Cladophialophora psammophila CBS 110553]EXJ59526.1 esterase/lipase [Cladophialophora psammophila CBS 110553]
MSLSSCCVTGFRWDGTPKGHETTLADKKAYVTGTNKDAAVLIVHDIFGWTLNNTRLLADHYAEEADVTVYLPDFFAGEIVTPDHLFGSGDHASTGPLDVGAFIGRHGKDIRQPEIFACAAALKKDLGYKKVGAIGFCYGGWAVFRLGAKGNNLVDCISTAHPSLLEKAEIDAVGCPTQLLAPEEDPTYTPELKEYSLKVLPTLNIDYDYQYFAGLTHGFATRGDTENPTQKKGLERAKNAAVSWFREYLH